MTQSLYYSSNAVSMTLSAGIASGDTTCTLSSTAGLPASFPFKLLLDWGAATQEVVHCTALAGAVATILRGQDGTTAQSHALGATVVHGVSAREFNDLEAHVAATSAAHGITGSFVGTTDTQTLSGKTLASPTINTPTINGATFSGSINGAATFDTNGHIAGGGSAPAATAGAGNGAAGPAPQVAAGSTDQAGKIDFGTGTGPGTTPQVVVTFNRAYAATPRVVVTPDTAASAGIALWVDAVSTTGFHVSSNTAPASGQSVGTYGFHYLVIG